MRMYALADFFDAPDNLVSGNQRQFRFRQFAIDDMQVCPANGARTYFHEKLSGRRPRNRQIVGDQRLTWHMQTHRAHRPIMERSFPKRKPPPNFSDGGFA